MRVIAGLAPSVRPSVVLTRNLFSKRVCSAAAVAWLNLAFLHSASHASRQLMRQNDHISPHRLNTTSSVPLSRIICYYWNTISFGSGGGAERRFVLGR